MPKPIEITKKDAQKLTLSCQGLTRNKKDTLEIIRQIKYVQIDTLAVTERSHNHVLFTRNSGYKPDELTQLMDDRAIFEYWSHAAAYLPMEDFRYSLPIKEQYKKGVKHWFPRDKKVDKYVLERIKAEGALQSKDFESLKNKTNAWYEWKPAKISLGNLFMDGTIMVSHRKGFQKVFDLTEKVVPDTIDTSKPSAKEYHRHLIFNAISSHGIVTLDEIGYLRKGIKTSLRKTVAELQENKEIMPVTIQGNDNVYFTTNATLELLNTEEKTRRKIHIINPFDNLLIQRKRMKDLFDFDYNIECYVPEKKRVFGYYTLPILWGDKFVARFDAKADRKSKIFIVKSIWYEKRFKPGKQFQVAFGKKLKQFAAFCGCDKLTDST